MDPLLIARWQFAIVTVYHFLFVPLTLSLSLIVAGLQTAYYRTGKTEYRRMTKFWGKLFLINFAIGVATGITQEFQFGMNWSAYSRFVGDIFGAPLAMEGLVAFFLESTFLGVWIFGWDRLPKKLHLASIWLAAIGTNLSAYFILAANSWMQHPVGFIINKEKNRAELKSIWSVISNSTALITFPHTIAAAFMTAGIFMVAISAWHIRRKNQVDLFTKSLKVGLITAFIATAAVSLTGHFQAQIMTRQQPMKMAAAEALWETEKSAGFSIFAVGDVENGRNSINVQLPRLLSFLATDTFDGEVQGINDIQKEYQEKYRGLYGADKDYRPVVGVTYWTFRLMMGTAFVAGLLALWGLIGLRRGKYGWDKFLRIAPWVLFLGYAGNSLGWIFTEIGRMPWTVFGVFTVAESVSPRLGSGILLTSTIAFTLIYAVLAVIAYRLMSRYAKAGHAESDEPQAESTEDKPLLSFAY